MTVDVKMKDGRTTYRFQSRGQAIAVMNRKPNTIDAAEHKPVRCARFLEENGEWLPARVMYLNASSIATIEQTAPEQRDATAHLLQGDRQLDAAAA